MTLSRLNGMTRTNDSAPRNLYEALSGLWDKLDDLENSLTSLRRPRPRNGDGKKIHPLSGPLRA